jgi:hypothetical protein
MSEDKRVTYAQLVADGIHEVFEHLAEVVADDSDFDTPEVPGMGIAITILAAESYLQGAWKKYLAGANATEAGYKL